jgi:hypothetical protein
MLTTFALVSVLAQTAASPAPSPVPSVSPAPAVSISGALAAYAFGPRLDVSDALVSLTRSSGTFRYGVMAGAYAFPVIGQPLASTFATSANTSLFGFVPIAYAGYAPNDHVSILAGKLATSIGAENPFTFQNTDIERDLSWNMEPVVSRGARLVYTNGTVTANIEYNDGYYSGSHRAVEGAFIWAPTGATSMEVSAIIPGANTPGNATASVANRSEYSLVMTRTVGKFSVTPYVVLAQSPASQPVGYLRSEGAWGAGFFGAWSFNDTVSLGGRYGYLGNESAAGDASANADFVGYGAGSKATTLTLTPEYKKKQFFVRGEYGVVLVSGGQQFGRLGVETGIQF